MSAVKFESINNIAGTSPSTPEQIAQGRAKAWVNFNGTGTVAIRDDFNVSSITDNNAGDYTVNFDNAMPNANYVAVGMGTQSSGNAPVTVSKNNRTAFTASSCAITTAQSSTRTDIDHVLVAIFGD